MGRWRGGEGLLLVVSPSRVSQRGSERRCSAIVSGGAARSRLELSHAPTSTSIHLPAFSASDRFLVWTIRPGCLPPPLPALNPINNAVGSRLRVTAALPTIRRRLAAFPDVSHTGSTDFDQVSAGHARLLTVKHDISIIVVKDARFLEKCYVNVVEKDTKISLSNFF